MPPRLVLHTRVVRGPGGGPDKTILNSARFLESERYRMLCAYLRHPLDPSFPKLEERARRWRADLVPVDDRGPFDLSVVGRLRAICREHRPAIWHAHDYKSNLLGLLVRRGHPMSLVTTVHGWTVRDTTRTRLYYLLDRLLLRSYDQIICVSEDLERSCLGLGVDAARCWYVPNAIDVEEYRLTNRVDSVRQQLGTPPDRMVVGSVGRLSPEKGLDRLVAATARLLSCGHDLELWIVGEGPQRGRLARRIDELGLEKRARLLGHHDDTLPLYRSMDVFASSSRHEGLPNALLEAMAMELPVVATRIAGVPSLVHDGENGLLVDPESEEELVEGLRRLVEDGSLRQRLGRAARVTVEGSFDFRHRMERISSIYDHALNGSGDRHVAG